MKKRPQQPSRKEILTIARNCLDDMYQWLQLKSLDTALKCETSAIAMIELLEVNDCGSTGGFDKEQGKRDLESRFEWLCKKHGDVVKSRFEDKKENWFGKEVKNFMDKSFEE